MPRMLPWGSSEVYRWTRVKLQSSSGSHREREGVDQKLDGESSRVAIHISFHPETSLRIGDAPANALVPLLTDPL